MKRYSIAMEDVKPGDHVISEQSYCGYYTVDEVVKHSTKHEVEIIYTGIKGIRTRTYGHHLEGITIERPNLIPTKVKFVGIDDWHRAVFKDDKKNFYCTLDELFSYGYSEQQVIDRISCPEDIVYKGSSFDSEPMGTRVPGIEIILSTEA